MTGKPLGPAFRHENQVWIVAFSRDGFSALIGDEEEMAHLWTVPPFNNRTIKDLETSIEAATGMLLFEDGSLLILDSSDWDERREKMAAGAAAGVG